MPSAPHSDPAIRVRGLRKRFGDRDALRGIDLDVARGETVALVGPNGAGKTTAVEILEGFHFRSGGEVAVLGSDPARPTRAWRDRIGIVTQESEPDPGLSVREAVALYAGYRTRPRSVDETLEHVGLADAANVQATALSGGQRRRLDLALALVGDPELLFLDEPTTGFDPSARRQAWDLVHRLRDLGKTVLLTTHYMDEAQALADRVIVIAEGEIIAEGTPDDLGGRAGARTTIRFPWPADRTLDGVPVPVVRDGTTARIETAAVAETLHALTGWALERDVDLEGLTVTRPSLEDAYLALVARDGTRR